MPFCHNCGATNPDWARFCDQCGTELIQVPSSTPLPETTQPASAFFPEKPRPAANTCPQCGNTVYPGEAFCDNCGAPLSAPAASPDQETAAPLPPQQHFPPPQPVGLPPVQPPADQKAPPPVSSPPPAAAPPAPTSTSLASIRLQIPSQNTSVALPAQQEALVGRSDAVSGVYPDVDLTLYGGLEQGVGRRHLRLSIQQGQLIIEDLDTTNGTFINGQRLKAGAPHSVKNGDEIRLGKLMLRIQM